MAVVGFRRLLYRYWHLRFFSSESIIERQSFSSVRCSGLKNILLLLFRAFSFSCVSAVCLLYPLFLSPASDGELNVFNLNFFLSVSHNNLPILIPAHWLLLTQLAILVLFLMNTSLSLTKYLPSLNPATIIFVNFAVFVLILTSKLLVPSPLQSFILNSTTATHCTIIFHSLKWKTPEHPELSCSCCHQNAKIFSHHSCSEISTLAENKWTH